MILNSIQLKNFRSHGNIKLNFSPKTNYIIGGNGQGKTSIIEAIFYLCTTKSNGARTDREAVSFDKEIFEIIGSFEGTSVNNVVIRYSINENRKYYFKDEKRITRVTDIIGKFPVVLLSPDDHAITQGPPGERRKFIDSIISQASDTYLRNILDYNKTLRQRSSLLGKFKEYKDKKTMEELEAWSSILIRTGTYIIKQRKKFIRNFNEYVNRSYNIILEEEEKPGILYSHLEGYTGSEVEKEFERLLAKRREEEIARGVNLVGPQRDDFVFDINRHNLKKYGSQGQHKTFQVVLRFAEFFYLNEVTGTAPIFLLDDIFGELDTNRAMKISKYLTRVGQAFITITDLSNLSFLKRIDSDKIIRLKAGEVTYA